MEAIVLLTMQFGPVLGGEIILPEIVNDTA
jgi:hypothetical protein